MKDSNEGPEFFLHLRESGAEQDGKGGASPKVAGPILILDVKKHTKCFYCSLSAAFSFQATGLLGGLCSNWLINKIRVSE